MITRGRVLLIIALSLVVAACSSVPPLSVPAEERAQISARLMRDIEILASDEFGGRKPGTPGGEQTVAFLTERMRRIGLTSGTNDPGSAWRASVELVSTRPLESKVTIRTKRGTVELPPESSAAYSRSRRALIDGVDVVFVGLGTQDIPPEEINGRIVIMLQETFNMAARDALFDADPAAIVALVRSEVDLTEERRFFDRETLFLASEDTNRLTAFVTREAFASALPKGVWERLLADADGEDFVVEPLEATIAIDTRTSRREFTSYNVLGLIPGAVRGSGAVMVMAHWDHLGECAIGTPDPICNGAVDNASGVALMFELAQRLMALGPHDRDIYVVATSAEEAGLLGVKALIESPPVPLDTIVGVFNFDTSAVAQAGSAVGFVGEGRTPLDGIVREVLSDGRRQLGNPEFAESFVRRHDGWALLEKGVPAILLSTAFSSEIVLGPYLAETYHKPGDEAAGIELGGAIDDLLLHEELVRRVASTELYPAPQQ